MEVTQTTATYLNQTRNLNSIYVTYNSGIVRFGKGFVDDSPPVSPTGDKGRSPPHFFSFLWLLNHKEKGEGSHSAAKAPS